MSRFRGAVRIAVFGVAGALLYLGALKLRSVDPFEEYRSIFDAAMESPYAVELSDVTVAAYDSGRPQARFHAAKIDVRRDEQEVWLRNCDRGLLYQDGKEKARFSASLIRWDNRGRKAEITGHVILRQEDLEVRTTRVVWEERKSLLTTPSPLMGRIEGGQFRALSATVNLAEDSARLVEGEWKGPAQAAGQGKSTLTRGEVTFRFHEASKSPGADAIVFINAEMVDEKDRFFRADRIEYTEKTKVALCTGKCAVRTVRADVTGEKAIVEREIEKATLTENMAMTLWPKPEDVAEAQKPPQDEDEDPLHSRRIAKGYPVKIVCDRVEYFYGDHPHAVLTGSLHARQDIKEGVWREITADRAVLDEENDILRVEGHVRMIASNGDEFEAEFIEVSTKEGDDSWRVGPGSGKTIPPEEKGKPTEGGGI